MRRCFDLALLSKYNVKSNPNVGAILVHKDRIIGEGYYEYFGGSHAEVNAFNSVTAEDRHLIPESTLYVSLEPCCIHGKTPPCTDRILKEGVSKVVVSVSDPNPKVHRQGLKQLKDTGIEVESGILESEGQRLIAPFRAALQKRPYIVLKFAQSSDGYIGKRGEQVWLTNKYSKVLAHKWRSELDAILVGHNTVLVDDPTLTTREYPGENPLRVILSNDVQKLKGSQVYLDEHPTLFAGLESSISLERPKEHYSMASDAGLQNLMTHLFNKGIHSILIEGGAKTINRFLELGLWDEARVLMTSTLLGSGIRAPRISRAPFKEEDVDGDRVSYFMNK